MIIQFIYNISIYISIKQTSFFIIYKYHLKIYKIPIIRLNNLYTVIKAKHLKFLYNKLKNKLSFVRDQITKYYNIKKIKGLFFEKRNKVYLFYKNITIKQSNNKLNFKKLKPFIIIQKILKKNYKLSLSKTIQIHLIFYIFLFEFILRSAKIQKRRIEIIFN